jgi:hypothetical protein
MELGEIVCCMVTAGKEYELVSTAMNMNATIEELLETVFSTRFSPRIYSKTHWECYDRDKWQTHPLVREGTPQWQNRKCLTVTEISSWAPGGAWHQGWLADWPLVIMWLWLEVSQSLIGIRECEGVVAMRSCEGVASRQKWKQRTSLGSVTRQPLVKTEDLVCVIMNCKVRELAIAL